MLNITGTPALIVKTATIKRDNANIYVEMGWKVSDTKIVRLNSGHVSLPNSTWLTHITSDNDVLQVILRLYERDVQCFKENKRCTFKYRDGHTENKEWTTAMDEVVTDIYTHISQRLAEE